MGITGMKKTTGKEYFYRVSGLMVPKYMVSSALEDDIEDFIDWVSKNTGNMDSVPEKQIKRGRIAPLKAGMESLYVMLCSIHAHWLELEAARILRLAETQEYEMCQKLIAPFISNVRTLALDLQMAQNREDGANYRQPGKGSIESCTHIISSVKIIDSLIKNAEYDYALDFALSLDELQESEYAVPLMSSVMSKDWTKACDLARDIISAYTGKIDGVIASMIGSTPRKKLLVVDDMPEILTALTYMLEEYYRVFAFSEGGEALAFIEKNSPDAFILDIDMPGMDGFTLARKIRKKPQYKETPLLFLTSDSTRETIMKSLAYNTSAFIVKPANRNIILSKLSGCLG